MPSPKVPYLTGGIFFSLILQARKSRTKARDKFDGGSDGLSDTDIMAGLIEVVTGDHFTPFQGKTFSKATSQFKSCQKYGATYIPFTSPSVISAFNSAVNKKDPDLLKRMSEFIDNFINEMRAEWLVKALLEVIGEETTKDVTEPVFCVADAVSVSRKDIDSITEVDLPVFLISILAFILNERKDNTEGRATFEAWHTHDGAKSPWRFHSNIGNAITRPISVKFRNPTIPIISSAQQKNSESEKDENTKVIIIPGEQLTAKSSYSSEDQNLLREFTADYDEITLQIIGENYAEALLDTTLAAKAQNLYDSKWSSKADAFTDPKLKSYVYGLLGELSTICEYFSADAGELPGLTHTRTKIRNLYVRLHPETYAESFPYEALIDDWNDGE